MSVSGAGTGTGYAFVVSDIASTTRFVIQDNGNIGVGTTSPGSLLSLGDTGANTINLSVTATSAFGSGINLSTGCFAINGTCTGDIKYSDARYEIVTATKNLADATGATQAITGCGFAPKAVMAFANVANTAMATWAFAENNGTAEGTSLNHPFTAANSFGLTGAGGGGPGVEFLNIYTSTTPDAHKGTISSWDADGFTITWTKQNSPTGTADLSFMCMR